MTRKITVTSHLGSPKIVTEGYEGDSCLEATRKLEETLSGEGGVSIREHNPVQGVEQTNDYETN